MSLLVQLVLNVNSHDSFNYNIYLFEMEQRFSHYEVKIKATRKLSRYEMYNKGFGCNNKHAENTCEEIYTRIN